MPLVGDEIVDDGLIQAEGLHLRWHNEPEAPAHKAGELTRMRDAHSNKIGRVQLDYNDHQDQRFLDGLEYEIEQQHPELSAQEVTDEVASQVVFYTAKRAKLVEVVRLCDVEMGFRDAGNKVNRLPALLAYEAVQQT